MHPLSLRPDKVTQLDEQDPHPGNRFRDSPSLVVGGPTQRKKISVTYVRGG